MKDSLFVFPIFVQLATNGVKGLWREKTVIEETSRKKRSPLSQQGFNFNVKDTIVMLQLYCGLDTVLIKGCAYYTSLQGYV